MSSIEQCDRCQAFCCVAPYYHPGIGFAEEKPAHHACRHLAPTHRCVQYTELHERGFPGCLDYRCHGAGPEVSAEAWAAGLEWHRLEGPPRAALLERFLERQTLYSAVAELGSLAPKAGLERELQAALRRIAALSADELAHEALTLAMELRMLCWQAQEGAE